MVYFIDAGPGDIELITVKSVKRIEQSDVIIYNGELINKEIVNYAKKNCVVYNSSKMSFKQIVKVLKEASERNKNVASIFTEDPCYNDLLTRLVNVLINLGINFEVIPGVSTFMSAASVIKNKFSFFKTPQTVIIKKIISDKSDIDWQSLNNILSNDSVLMIQLKQNYFNCILEELKNILSDDTQVVIVYSIEWNKPKYIRSTLREINEKFDDIKVRGNIMITLGSILENDINKNVFCEKSVDSYFRESKIKTLEKVE